jgi:hypothetical protein
MRGGHLALLFGESIPSLISGELEAVEPSAPTRRPLAVGRRLAPANDYEQSPGPFTRARERAVA